MLCTEVHWVHSAALFTVSSGTCWVLQWSTSMCQVYVTGNGWLQSRLSGEAVHSPWAASIPVESSHSNRQLYWETWPYRTCDAAETIVVHASWRRGAFSPHFTAEGMMHCNSCWILLYLLENWLMHTLRREFKDIMGFQSTWPHLIYSRPTHPQVHAAPRQT